MADLLPLWLQETAALERREHPRSRVLWMAMLDTPEGPLSCVIIDVSKTGAKLQFAATIFPALVWQPVELHIEPMGSLRGEVVWQLGDKLGIRFTVAPDYVQRIVGSALIS